MQAKYDIAVYGATGFTGQLAARTLADVGELRLVLAGRNREKLEAVQKTCKNQPEIFVAEAHDEAKIRELVSQSRVIINFAGPYSRRAEPLIAACAELGRNYCDITGETVFIADMIAKYQSRALETQAVLIPMAGFDSVPADVTSFLALEAARKSEIQLTRLDHYYTMRGGFNGGTLETTMSFGEEQIKDRYFDENILIPDSSWPRSGLELKGAQYETLVKAWTAPFFMQMANAPVMRRARFLAGDRDYATVPYSERMVVGPGLAGRLAAKTIEGAVQLIFKLVDSAAGRKVLRTLGPSPGEGPSEKSQKNGFYSGLLIGREGEANRILVTFKVKGDPGNIITVLFATEIAKLLLEEKSSSQGFTTASLAFGDRFFKRLEAKGAKLSVKVLN